MDVRLLRAERDETIKKYITLRDKALQLEKRYYKVIDIVGNLLEAIESLAQMSWWGRIKFVILGSGYLRVQVDTVLKQLGQDQLAKHVARQALQLDSKVTTVAVPQSQPTPKV